MEDKKIIEFQNSFENLDFGTVVTTSTYTSVNVKVDPNYMMDGYSRAIDRDIQRRNPVRYDAILNDIDKWITQAKEGQFNYNDMSEIISYYVVCLCKIRIQAVQNKCNVWRLAKQLGIPPYVQFALTMIGEVIDTVHGRKFVPEIDDMMNVNIKLLIEISNLLKAFIDDGITLLFDAFPRSKEGDQDAMSYAIIDGYVKGIERKSIAKSYIAVFLGLKLKQETELKSLYSIRYDNAEYVRDCLLNELGRW